MRRSDLEEPDHVEERRRLDGLESPTDRLARADRQPLPKDRVRFEREYEEWLRRVGWRK